MEHEEEKECDIQIPQMLVEKAWNFLKNEESGRKKLRGKKKAVK